MAQSNFSFKYSRDYDRVAGHSAKADSKLNFEKLATRFEKADTSLTDYNTLALLIGYTQKADYQPEMFSFAEGKLFSLNAEGEFEKANILASDLLNKYPYSSVALIEKAYACKQLGIEDSIAYYGLRFRKIMQAMIYSGDGETPETAIFALSINDARNFVRKVLRAEVGLTGELKNENGDYVLAIEAIFEKETEAKMTTINEQETPERNMYFKTLFFVLEHLPKE